MGPSNSFSFHPSQHAGQAKAMNMKIGNYLSNPEAHKAKNNPALFCWCFGFFTFLEVAFNCVLKVVIISDY